MPSSDPPSVRSLDSAWELPDESSPDSDSARTTIVHGPPEPMPREALPSVLDIELDPDDSATKMIPAVTAFARALDSAFPDDDDDPDDARTRMVPSEIPSEAQGSDQRDTIPPPLPESEYVQTMMLQAEPELEPAPPSSPRSWRTPSPPSSGVPSPRSWRTGPPTPEPVSSGRTGLGVRGPASVGPPSELRRALVAEPSPGRAAPITSPSPPFNAPSPPARGRPMPPPRRAPTPYPGGLALVPIEPEPWSGRSEELSDPRFAGMAEPAGFDALDELPFDDLVAASQRSVSEPPGVVPVPRPLKLGAPAAPSPPASPRRETEMASIPPILGMAWGSPPEPAPRSPAPEPDPIAPPTKRGLFDSPVPPPPRPATKPFAPSTGSRSPVRTEAPSTRPPITKRAAAAAPPSSRRAPAPAADPFDEVRELFDAGDFRSALVMAEAFLAQEPEHSEAQRCAQSCRDTLAQKYLSRLGGRGRLLRVAMAPDEIRWLSLDHKAGFLLSCIDGTTSIDEVIDLASMPEFEAIRILHDFRELGVIEVVPERQPRR